MSAPVNYNPERHGYVYMNKEALAKQILATLSKQWFADWYNTGNFNKYILGDHTYPSEEKILEEICRLFHLE